MFLISTSIKLLSFARIFNSSTPLVNPTTLYPKNKPLWYNSDMKIALLGYGKEGKAVEAYFKNQAEIDVFENFTPEEIKQRDYSPYDIIFRSPSVPPLGIPHESSVTKFFFEHCPCPIIGVTATKGKGTTCSFIKSLLDAHHADAYLVGNIGIPAIEVLDKLTPDSVVVYEMSSFQLWDLEKSPHISVVGIIEPDHLNVHNGFEDYLNAKANIAKHQAASDFLIYFKNNPDSVRIADTSKAQKISYPFKIPASVANAVRLPGEHNLNNAIAAIAAVACYKNISPDEYLTQFTDEIIAGLSNFHGLPHRLEFLREFNGVKYYDDNFSTNPSSTRVAINSFPSDNVIVIIGGRDKTENADLPEIYEVISAPNVKKVILMGESGHELSKKYQDPRFVLAKSLEQAVDLARKTAEEIAPSVLIMSPSAASFDMFENVYDRGARFQNIVKNLV